MFTWAFSSTYNCWVVPELLCLKSFWRLGRADQRLLRSDHNGQYGKKIMSQTHPRHQTTVYLWEGKQEGTNHYPFSANVKSVSAIKKSQFWGTENFPYLHSQLSTVSSLWSPSGFMPEQQTAQASCIGFQKRLSHLHWWNELAWLKRQVQQIITWTQWQMALSQVRLR